MGVSFLLVKNEKKLFFSFFDTSVADVEAGTIELALYFELNAVCHNTL